VRKRNRQERLLQLVRERPIASQAELVASLTVMGVGATQASVSRDLRELGIVKLNGRYAETRSSGLEGAGAAEDARFDLINKAEPVGANLVVIRTHTGCANSVAAALDERELPEAVGTLAGDDTIFIAVRSRNDQGKLYARLRGWMGRRGQEAGHVRSE